MAHLGGFSCGLLFAVPMVPRLGSPRPLFVTRLQIAVIMVMGLLVLFGFYLAQLPPRAERSRCPLRLNGRLNSQALSDPCENSRVRSTSYST